jgi:hypothetical protein
MSRNRKKDTPEAKVPVLSDLDALRDHLKSVSDGMKEAARGYQARSYENIQRSVAAGNLSVDPEDAMMMRIGAHMTPLTLTVDSLIGDISQFIVQTRLRLSGKMANFPEPPVTTDRLACDHIMTDEGVVFGEKLEDGKMILRKGSAYVRRSGDDLFDVHAEKRKALEVNAIVAAVPGSDENDDQPRMEFTRDFVFDSPGEASAVATGVRHRRSEWRRISYPALIVAIDAHSGTVSPWLKRASTRALGMIDPLDPKWEGRHGHDDECMIAEDDFRFGGMPFSIGARKVRVQVRGDAAVDRAKTNALREAALRVVAPGGRPSKHGRFHNDKVRVAVATRTSENPWQFQINRSALEWTLDTKDGQTSRVMLVCGWFGYVDFATNALETLLSDLWRENDKGHEVCWIEAIRASNDGVELRPVPDRSRMLPLNFRTVDTVELP